MPHLCDWIIYHHQDLIQSSADLLRVWLPGSYVRNHSLAQAFQYCYPNRNVAGWCKVDTE